MHMNTFPNGRTDALVKAWLAENGIDANIVSGYRIERSPRSSTITLECYFDDPEVSPSDRGASGIAVLPRKIKDREGSIFIRRENETFYRLDRGDPFGRYALNEIERDYGPVTVVEQ